MIDAHLHLCHGALRDDADAALDRARAAGVRWCVETGVDLPSSRAAVALAERHADVVAVVGILAHSANTVDARDLAELAALAAHPKVVGIGEIGLDYQVSEKRPSPPAPERQQWLFRAQLELAQERGLPVVIHTREADEDTLMVLRAFAPQGLNGMIHSYMSLWPYGQAYLDLGLCLSLSGPVTYLAPLREVVPAIPLDRLLTETDSPHLPPAPRGRRERNEPAHVRFVAEQVAQLRGMPVSALNAAVTTNAQRLFRLPTFAPQSA